jgi:hypothetical protein
VLVLDQVVVDKDLKIKAIDLAMHEVALPEASRMLVNLNF